MGFWTILLSIVLGIGAVALVINVILYYFKTRDLVELKDCPFKFKPFSESGVAFKLCDGAVLQCSYSLGIRSDGYYGISEITILGINGSECGVRNLKVGQSVFPIISAYDKFMDWINTKPFKVDMHRDFANRWLEMKKNLNNLRYLETEEQKKKSK